MLWYINLKLGQAEWDISLGLTGWGNRLLIGRKKYKVLTEKVFQGILDLLYHLPQLCQCLCVIKSMQYNGGMVVVICKSGSVLWCPTQL